MPFFFQTKNTICPDCYWPFSADKQSAFNNLNLSQELKHCQNCPEPGHTKEKSQPAAITRTPCADCGQQTSLPLALSGSRRVHCASCFMKKFHLFKSSLNYQSAIA